MTFCVETQRCHFSVKGQKAGTSGVMEAELWSLLSVAAVVSNPFLKTRAYYTLFKVHGDGSGARKFIVRKLGHKKIWSQRPHCLT